ncbi:MBL fold metallo-hydrolase [Bacillus sp. V33-4]|uniref:MBL fold metallo-hydrolase n=1 Tax=Bacillus sp. V33-4 TaxID=2054169 RepID=UPI000C78F97F|nr:MBL fold metallo-hydrolase [Bacillus sp. V33-4]PLR81224.1 MBL fold metallo-hydrolase [Bacillus sp. V33-4]
MISLKDTKCEVFPIIVPVLSSLNSINFFLFRKDQTLILIDAGLNNEECWQALELALAQNGFTLKDISQIILTHHHIDHVGLVNRIVSKTQVPVYAHRASKPRLKRDSDFLNMRADFFSQLYKEMGCGDAGHKQSAYLRASINKNKMHKIEGPIFEITGKQWMNFEIIEVPGHAPDQITFFEKERKWLFAGDLLIEHISSNALVEPDENGKRLMTLSQHRKSLDNCLSLDIDHVFPGHGTLIRNPQQLIKKRLDGIESKAAKFAALIESGISTGSKLAQVYYKEKYSQQFSLVMSEIIGHLDYLEMNGRIVKESINGVWHYSVGKK